MEADSAVAVPALDFSRLAIGTAEERQALGVLAGNFPSINLSTSSKLGAVFEGMDGTPQPVTDRRKEWPQSPLGFSRSSSVLAEDQQELELMVSNFALAAV